MIHRSYGAVRNLVDRSPLNTGSALQALGDTSNVLTSGGTQQTQSSSSIPSVPQAVPTPPAANQIAGFNDRITSSDVIGDFNRDGWADILWRNAETGENNLWIMNGLTPIGNVDLPYVTDTNWHIVGVADYTRDGWVDILWRNYATGENTVWQMSGTAATGSISLPAITNVNWVISGSSDFTGDGQGDILWRNYATGENTIWQMNGTNVVTSIALPTITDTPWSMVGGGDFNGDGQNDILWRNYTTGENTIWTMAGANPYGSISILGAYETNFYVGGIGDFNRDGQADIFWRRNAFSGDNVIWLMNRTTPIGGAPIAAVTGSEWRVGLRLLNQSTVPQGQPDLKGTFFDVRLEPLFSGESFTADVDISNLGSRSTSSSFRVSFYLSSNNTISTSDYFLNSVTLNSLTAGGRSSFSVNLTLPRANNYFWSGSNTYYIGMIVDSGNAIAESNEQNNSSTGDRVDYDAVFVWL